MYPNYWTSPFTTTFWYRLYYYICGSLMLALCAVLMWLVVAAEWVLGKVMPDRYDIHSSDSNGTVAYPTNNRDIDWENET